MRMGRSWAVGTKQISLINNKTWAEVEAIENIKP